MPDRANTSPDYPGYCTTIKRGLAICKPPTCSGVILTIFVSPACSDTGIEKVTPSIVPVSSPSTASSERLASCVSTVQPCLFQGLGVHFAMHRRMCHRYLPGNMCIYFAKDTHTLIGRSGIPVNKPNVRIARLGTETLRRQVRFSSLHRE